MRGFRDWTLQPLLTAVLLILLGGLVHAFLPWQHLLTALQAYLVKSWRPDQNQNLSDSLLFELRNGGFTFFVRHASRDEVSIAIDCVVRDRDGQRLAYVYFEDEPGQRSAVRAFS